MKILLICDGSEATERGARFLHHFQFPGQSRIVLLAAGKVTRRSFELENHLARVKLILQNHFVLVDQLVLPGRFLDQIRMETMENEYDLVVLGEDQPSQALGRLSKPKNAAPLLAHRLNIPLLIVRGLPERLDRVLICTSGKPAADFTLQTSGKLLAGLPGDVIVHLLHVAKGKTTKKRPDEVPSGRTEATSQTNILQNQYFTNAQELLRKSGIRASVQQHSRIGAVVNEVLAEVNQNDHQLMVIGAHHRAGRSWLVNSILEDVAKGLVQESPCSILVVG